MENVQHCIAEALFWRSAEEYWRALKQFEQDWNELLEEDGEGGPLAIVIEAIPDIGEQCTLGLDI